MSTTVHQASVLNQEENENDESNVCIEMSVMDDAENADIQPECTEANGLNQLVKSDRVTCCTIIWLYIGFVLHLVDIGSDIWVTYKYFSEGSILSAILTMIFVFVPAIINMIISFRMDKQNKRSNNNERFPLPKWKRNLWIKALMFLLLFAPLCYSRSSIRYARKSRKYKKENNKKEQRYYYDRMHYEDEEFAMLKIFDAFLEAAPQQTLQLTILLSNPDKTALPPWYTIVSLCTSFLSMAWAMTSYHRNNRLAQDDKSEISKTGLFLQFLWHIFITVSRILTISILASQWVIYTIYACFLHWIIMTLWLIFEPFGIAGFCGSLDRGAGEPLTLKEKLRSWLFAAVLGFVYIFTHINPGENKTFLRHLFYYVLCGIENLVAVIIWTTISDQSVKSAWYFAVLVSLTVVTFIIGILSMISYYKYFHPNLDQNDSSSQGISRCTNCSCEALGCLSAFVLCHFF